MFTQPAITGIKRTFDRPLPEAEAVVAHRALALEPSLALLLPCNVALDQTSEGRIHVTVADPRALIGVGTDGPPALVALGEEAASALQRAIERLGT